MTNFVNFFVLLFLISEISVSINFLLRYDLQINSRVFLFDFDFDFDSSIFSILLRFFFVVFDSTNSIFMLEISVDRVLIIIDLFDCLSLKENCSVIFSFDMNWFELNWFESKNFVEVDCDDDVMRNDRFFLNLAYDVHENVVFFNKNLNSVSTCFREYFDKFNSTMSFKFSYSKSDWRTCVFVKFSYEL